MKCARGHEPVFWESDDPCFVCKRPGVPWRVPPRPPYSHRCNPDDASLPAGVPERLRL